MSSESPRSLEHLRPVLDDLYNRYNHRRFVHPDPLEFLYEYDDPADREIVALVASSLAYGRVAQILRSVRSVLDRLGPSPAVFLARTQPRKLPEIFAGFKHRWTTGLEVAQLLAGARRAIDRFGSLGRSFAAGLRPEDTTVLPALATFVDHLRPKEVTQRNSLLPNVPAGVSSSRCPMPDARCPSSSRAKGALSGRADGSFLRANTPTYGRSTSRGAGGSCKRLHLMLRWLVRQDAVDPGGWDFVSPSLLVIPLDTHMHQVGQALGLCSRSQADCRSALAMTAAFRTIRPGDPVRYDFALTRLGIRSELDLPTFLANCRSISRHP